MNRAILFVLSIAALVLFGTAAAHAADCVDDDGAAANCVCDLTGDGVVNAADDAAMQAAVQAGDPIADLDGSGTVNATDYNLYVIARNGN